MPLGLSRRTVRLRFTVLYGALFFLSGAVLLAIVNLAVNGASQTFQNAPAEGMAPQRTALADAHLRIEQLQEQLAGQQAEEARRLLLASVVALALMALVSVVLGRFVAGRVLRPLRMMTASTRRISADNLHERLDVPGPADEVKALADTIDGLLERLEGAFAAQRRFVANASHELRTPLTTMRASLDVAEAKPGPVPEQTRALAGRLRTELDQVDRLLEGLLVLARTQHGALPGHETLTLGGVVSAALAERAAGITARDLTVRADVRDGGSVQGSPTLLARMVGNVIDNAIRHNHDGGWIGVATETVTPRTVTTRTLTTGAGDAGAGDAAARLVVETGGPVLAPEQVAQLAQPFRRLGADRTGSDGGAGLGLSIVAAVATAHGGTLGLHARAEGGLRVTISLPLADPTDGTGPTDGKGPAGRADRAATEVPA